MSPLSLRGARVLLTGATGGLGQAIAHRLKAEGSELILTGRRVDVLEPLAKATGGTAIAADLGRAEDIDRLLNEAGSIDVLIANAALPATGKFDEMTQAEIDRNLDVNLRAPIAMTRALLPQLLERGRGHIVLIGSVSGIVASPYSAMYNATKFGLRGFAGAMRQDLHGTGVGMSIVEPGFVRDAGMFVNSGMAVPRGTRFVTPEQVASGVVRAVTKDKGEVVVAPVELRLGARLGSVAPEVNARLQRAAGAADIISKHAGNE